MDAADAARTCAATATTGPARAAVVQPLSW
jgi:hypothetical protein